MSVLYLPNEQVVKQVSSSKASKALLLYLPNEQSTLTLLALLVLYLLYYLPNERLVVAVTATALLPHY